MQSIRNYINRYINRTQPTHTPTITPDTQQLLNNISENIFNQLTLFDISSNYTSVITIDYTESQSIYNLLTNYILSTSILDNNILDNSFNTDINPEININKFKCKFNKIDTSNNNLPTICAITLDEFIEDETICKLPCNHCFKTNAIEIWLNTHSTTCPICRISIE